MGDTSAATAAAAPAEAGGVAGAAVEGNGRSIVVAVDTSDYSMRALQWCLDHVVKSSPDTVYLVTVEASVGSASSAAAIPEDEQLEGDDLHVGSQTSDVLSRAAELCAAKKVTHVSKVYEGDPRESICQACEDVGADMLIVGSRGLTGSRRAFLGHVSHHCARYARCPVLVIRSKGLTRTTSTG